MTEIEVKPSLIDNGFEEEVVESYNKHMQTNGGRSLESPVTIWFERPIAVPQMVFVSRRMTHRFNRPIIVLPRSIEALSKRFQMDSYCKFKATITAEFETTRTIFEIFKTGYYWLVNQETGDKQKCYEVNFLVQPDAKGSVYDPFNSFSFERYYYNAISDTDDRFILLSERKLEVGQEYVVTGSCFSTKKFDATGVVIGKKQQVCLAQYIVEEDTKIDWTLIEKCKGKDMAWFTESVTYPYENSLAEYSELMTVNTLHLQTGFPFNLVLIGGADRTKTAFLVKMSAITNSLVYETGASTVKGLLPSFSRDNMDAGILASSGCKHKALVNEFFEILTKVNKSIRASYLNSLKSTLEGRLTPFVSGLGKMTVRQRGDLLAATNFPSKQGGYRFHSVYEIYDDLDPAFLDRILFYTVPRDQEKMVMEHKDRVKALLMATGKTDDVEALIALDYGNLLKPKEIRQLMALARKCRPILVDVNHKKEVSKQFSEQLPSERFTRHSEFLTNIASAYAFIRVLADGSLRQELETTNSPTVEISNVDVDRAANFLWCILNSYQSLEGEMSERHTKLRMLTPKEVEVYGLLLEHYKRNENVHLKKLLAKDVIQFAGGDSTIVQAVLDKGLAICDGVMIQWMPELSVEAAEEWKKLINGDRIDKRFGFYLAKQGLASKREDEYGNVIFDNPWVRKHGLGVVL